MDVKLPELNINEQDKQEALAYVRSQPGLSSLKDHEIIQQFGTWYKLRTEKNCRERQLLEVHTTLAQRDKFLHGKFGFVQDPNTEERKCACAYCTGDVEALADHSAEMECQLYLPDGWKDRALKAEQRLLEMGLAAQQDTLAPAR